MDLDLYIDCPLGATLRLAASACDTVLSVKLRLQTLLRNSLPANQQRLVWRACELANERRLIEYGVVSGCTLRLLPHLHAGPASLRQLPTPLQPSPPSNTTELQPQLAALAATYRQAWENLQQHFLHYHNYQHGQQQPQQPAVPNVAKASYYLVYCLRPNAATTSDNGGAYGHCFDLVGISCCLAMPGMPPTAVPPAAAASAESATQPGHNFETSDSTPMSKSGAAESADEASTGVTDASRCYACHRRTGISGSFACRCGQVYCSRHRYPESHACSYDYKAQGRQIIREANPRVLAPKLQRI